MWKHLRHPNVVPLLGVTTTPAQLVSMWMPRGDLLDNVKRPDANPLSLVSVVPTALIAC